MESRDGARSKTRKGMIRVIGREEGRQERDRDRSRGKVRLPTFQTMLTGTYIMIYGSEGIMADFKGPIWPNGHSVQI